MDDWRTMKIAIEGCGHGELDKIYETVAFIEERDKIKVDLLLCCGDFQAVRNKSDLKSMAVPPKYQKLNTFYKYYSGEKKAPVLTIFIGGNHEASNYLQELSYGGWVAPNIYYMGYGNVLQFGGVRIAGLSGIYKGRDYFKGHHERAPYSEDTKRTVYHIRVVDVFRLKQISRPIDIMLSHDWPRGVYNYGNAQRLIRHKKHFREEVETDTLGSPPGEELLYKMKPSYWFSAHLHVKFAAFIQHKDTPGEAEKTTKFLALDKCLPNRRFLQILDVPHDASRPLQLELDPEWMCILKSTNHLLNTTHSTKYMPGPGCSERWDFTVTDEEIAAVKEDFGGDLSIPNNFERTAPPHNDAHPKEKAKGPPQKINPQTSLLCEMLSITDPLQAVTGLKSSLDADLVLDLSANPDEIALDDEDEDEDDDDQGDKEGDKSNDDNVESDDDAINDTDDSSANYSSFITSFNIDGGNDTLESSCLSTDEDGIPRSSGEDTGNAKSSESDNVPESPSVKQPPVASDIVASSHSQTEQGDSLDAAVEGGDAPDDIPQPIASGDAVHSTPLKSSSPTVDEPKVKKFKRRNVAMYSLTGDESYS